MRALRFPELKSLKGVPYSRVHLDRLERAGEFPKRFALGPNSIAWLESEVDAWLKQRAAASRGPLPVGNKSVGLRAASKGLAAKRASKAA